MASEEETVRVALKNLELKNTYKAFCVLKIKKHHEEHTAALAACVPNDDAAAAKVAEAYKKTEKAVECFEGASGRVRHALCTVRHMGVQPPAMLSVFFPMESSARVAFIRAAVVDGRQEDANDAAGVVRPPCCSGPAADCCTRLHAGGTVCDC